MGRVYHCGRHHPVGPGLYNTGENELIRHKHIRITSLFSALDCGWDMTDSKFLLLWLLSDREVHVVWTMSQIDTFSFTLLFVSIILSQQWGKKKTKIHGFWGSNSDPLYWLGYSPVPKEISFSGYQELAQDENFPHQPFAIFTLRLIHTHSALLRPFLRGRNQEGTKAFLVLGQPQRDTLSPGQLLPLPGSSSR